MQGQHKQTRRMCTFALVAGVVAMGLAHSVTPASAIPCSRAADDPVALFKELTDVAKLTEVHRDASYIALQDKKTWAMWTFTREGQAAHPAVVCRRPVVNNKEITLEMVVGCKGEEKACAVLKQEFSELNARMQLEVNGKKKQ